MRRISVGAPAPKIDKRHGHVTVQEWLYLGKWVRAISSNVRGLAYDRGRAVLLVEFKGGSVYEYHDVPTEVAAGLFTSTSVGKYLHWQIKVQGYAYRRIK